MGKWPFVHAHACELLFLRGYRDFYVNACVRSEIPLSVYPLQFPGEIRGETNDPLVFCTARRQKNTPGQSEPWKSALERCKCFFPFEEEKESAESVVATTDFTPTLRSNYPENTLFFLLALDGPDGLKLSLDGLKSSECERMPASDLIDIPVYHSLVPLHEQASPSESKLLLKALRISDLNLLPILPKNDRIARFYNFPVDSLIKITRDDGSLALRVVKDI